LLKDIHSGICGNHAAARTIVGKAYRQGFFASQTIRSSAPPRPRASPRAAPAPTSPTCAAGRSAAPSPAASATTCPRARTHSNGIIEVPLPGALARAGGASPSWTDPTCASVYCHGATLVDGPAATPAWASSSSLGCTSCHGAPPSNHAPSSTNCSACHPGTVKADGTIDLAKGLHLDGVVEVTRAHPSGWAAREQHGYSANATGLAGCKSCHGADLNGAASAPSCTTCHADAGQAGWATSCT